MTEYALVEIDSELDEVERFTIGKRLSIEIENSTAVSVGDTEQIEKLLYE